MKELQKKIFAILATALMLINSSLLTVISMAVDGGENTIDTSKITAVSELNLEKYVNYDVDESKGVLVKLDLKTGIEYEEDQEYVAIKTTALGLKTPQINGEYPEKVVVQGISTKATNGSSQAKDFEYSYNDESGQITILASNNEDEDGNIYTEKVENARDEYKIILYYSSNCYNSENSAQTLTFTKATVETLSDDDSTEIVEQSEVPFEVAENVSGLVSTEITTTEIYNGKINANIQNETSLQTEYTETLKINIDYNKISDEIEITEDDSFINNNGLNVETENIIYKSTSVNKNNILNILGEDGSLQIFDKDNNLLLEVNKDTEAEEDGTVKIDYENEISGLKIKTTKPQKLGKISIKNTKAIKETMLDLSNTKIKTTANISCVNNIVEKDEETQEVINEYAQEVYNYEDTKETEIQNSQTKVDVTVDSKDWTNSAQNDVNFGITLTSNDIKYNLFKNPVIEIKLPAEVDNVILGNASVLNNLNLSTEATTEVVESGENLIIRVKLEGVQNEYSSNDVYGGPYILLPATIILKNEMESTTTNIEYTYSNESGIAVDYELEGNTSKQIEVSLEDMYSITQSASLMTAPSMSAMTVSSTSLTSNEETTSTTETTSTNTGSTGTSVVGTTVTATSTAGQTVSNSNTIDGLDASIKAYLGDEELQNNQNIHENEYIKYVVSVKNSTEEIINNIKVVGEIPDGTTYVEITTKDELSEEDIEYELYDKCRETLDTTKNEYSNVFNLEAGKQAEIVYYVKANELSSGETEKEISTNIEVYVEDAEQYSYELTNNAIKADIGISLTAWETERDINLWRYTIKATNNTSQDIENAVINLTLPSEMDYEYTEQEWYTVEEQEGNLKISFNDGELLAANDSRELNLYIKAYGEENISEYTVTTQANISGKDTDTYYSNINIQKMVIIV